MNKIRRKPIHPGKIILEDYLKPLSITVTDMASILGVSRKTLSKILNERGSITPDMSLRLARAFDTTPELWINLQKNFDLWQAEHVSNDWQRVKPLPVQQLHANL
jgi:antitoxin HigA-1